MLANDGTDRRERRGFTLVELLIVVVILGILATIGIFSTRSVTSRAYRVTLEADLKLLATHQELYHQRNMDYATLAQLSEYGPSEGVDVTVGWAAGNGFAATAVHGALPGLICGYFVGPAPVAERGPATQEADIGCE